IKLPFSQGVSEAMEQIVPIVLDGDIFICGMTREKFPLSGFLHADTVRNTIEHILRGAAKRPIHFEVIEGTTLADWQEIKVRREKAQEAMVAISEKRMEEHHFEDIIIQIIAELRQRITSTPDRVLPQVRARLLFATLPALADAEDVLFHGEESHEARRTMARAMERVSTFLEVPPYVLAMEVERYRASHGTPIEPLLSNIDGTE
ncbi:MAG: hypothetical protein ABI210_02885, partial [Abditibacteriaceae bacterium]